MTLPTLAIPKYKTILPVSKKEIEYRPFLVKEEKILIIADSSDDENDIETAIEQVISNCTFGKINAKKLCQADLEWIILQIRARAKGYTTTLSFKCDNIVDDKPCGMVNDIDVDLHDVIVSNPADSDLIDLCDGVGIKMSVPNVEVLTAIGNLNESEVAKSFLTLAAHIEQIYDNDQVWETKDLSREEIEEFVESFSDEHMKKIESWVSKTPTLSLNVKYKCASCGVEDTLTIEGIDSFFD